MEGSGRYLLAEGPVYDTRNRTLYFVDILDRRLYWKRDDGVQGFSDWEDFVTSVHLCRSVGKLLVTTRATVYLFEPESGKRRCITSLPLPPDMRFNDGAVAPDGSLWMGTMRIDRPRDREGELLRITESGYEVIGSGFRVANGLSFLDERTIIHIDSGFDVVRLCRISGNGLEVVKEHRFKEGESPDGCTLSADGTLMTALWGSGEIALLDALTLEEKGRISGFKTCLSSIALTDDGRFFATSAEDGSGSGLLYEGETDLRKGEDYLWKDTGPLW